MECKLPSNEDPAGSLVTYEGLLLLLGKHSFTQDELQLQEHSNIIAKRPTLCQVFVDLVLASRHVHEDLERDRLSVTAASNAISVLNYGSRSGIFEFRFIDVRDWSGIRIPGANLNYAVMAHCNLTDANLSGATMIHITLVGAQLTRANLSGIQTGEMMVFHTRSESETTASSPDNLIVHPNGYVAASGDSAGIIRIFNLETDEDIGYLNGHTFAIRSLAFNRDGTYLSSISDDETLRIWDVATYECKSLVQLHASKNLFSDYVAFSPDTTRIVVVWIRERFRVWNIGTSEWGMEFEHECVKDVDWSSDGRHILSFSMQGLLRLWDAESGVRIAEWVENHVYITNAKFTPDSTKIVVNGKKCISILNAMTAKVIATIPQPGSDGSRFAIDDRYVYLSSRLFIHAFDLERGKKCVTKFVDTPKSRTLFSVAEGKRLIVYCDKARTLRVFDTASFGLCVPSTIEGNPRYLSVTFCPNNRHLVAGYFGLDGDLKFLDALTGYCLETVRAQSYQNEISGLQCCPNGRLIAFRAGYMNVIDVYDVNERKCLPSLRHVSGVLCYTFSPKGDILASGLDRRCHCEHNAGNIILWDTTTWTWRVLRGHTERVHDVCFSPDGKMLASGSEDQTIRIWNVATEECVKVLCDDLLYGTVYLSYSPCGRFLASLNAGCLRIWNMTTLTCVTSYTSAADVLIGKFLFLHGGRILVRNPAYQMFDLFTGECVDLGVAPNAKLCMSYDHRLMTTKVSIDAWNAMYVWRFQKESWESRVVLEDPIIAKASASVQLLKVVPEEGGIVVVSTSDQDGSIWIQSSGKDATPTLLHGHSDLITCTQVSSDNLYLVSGSRDGTIRLWNLQTNQCVGTLEGHTGAISCVQFVQNNELVISGSHDITIRVWNTSECTSIGEFVGHSTPVKQIICSPDHKRFASVGLASGAIYMWDFESSECTRILDQHADEVFDLQFSANGAYLVSGSADDTIRVWDTKTGECIAILKGHTDCLTCFVIAPDSRTVVSGSEDTTIRIWNVTTGECSMVLNGHTHHIRNLCITPDNRCVISASNDHVIHIWDMTTGTMLHQLLGHTDAVTSVKLVHYNDQGESLILSTSSDQTIRLWTVTNMSVRIAYQPELISAIGTQEVMEFAKADFTDAIMDHHLATLIRWYNVKKPIIGDYQMLEKRIGPVSYI